VRRPAHCTSGLIDAVQVLKVRGIGFANNSVRRAIHRRPHQVDVMNGVGAAAPTPPAIPPTTWVPKNVRAKLAILQYPDMAARAADCCRPCAAGHQGGLLAPLNTDHLCLTPGSCRSLNWVTTAKSDYATQWFDLRLQRRRKILHDDEPTRADSSAWTYWKRKQQSGERGKKAILRPI
jgi:hypothetical protein